ncbi:MAG: tetraacyldisaccharide 4'-kinase [Deltaproteobacteria bacterium]|nr:tetraacyldisaccharide 4'-kinase [Deltaproteobacteria bacterium]
MKSILRVSKPLARYGSALFGLAVRARGTAYDTGLFPVRRVDGIKVISVGNLRVGGSGKTPFSMYIAARLRDAGQKTALLYRGYRGRLEAGGGLVSAGDGPLVSWKDAGDEAYLAAERLKAVSVWVGEDRVASAQHALDAGAEVAVMDDGFQHRRLYRDLDILLVCPEDLANETSLLPAGPLREPASAVSRADLTVGFASDWKGHTGAPEVLIDYLPTSLVHLSGTTAGLESYRNARAYLVAGLGRPRRFQATAREAGFNVVGTTDFRDHHFYENQDARNISQRAKATRADLILTTEKDAVRMAGLQLDLPVSALRIDVRLSSGAELLRSKIGW